MKMLYESAIADMIRLLDKTVDDFSMANDISGVTPLFCISNKQFLLMKTVDYFSNYQVLNGCRQLCIDMCEQMKLPIKIIAGDEDVDFILEVDDKSIGVLLSFKPNFMPNVSDELMYAIEKLMVVVLQDSVDGQVQFYKPNSYKYRNYKYKERVEQIVVKHFLEMLGRDDYDDFKECVGQYNYNAEQKLGITVSAIPTKKAVEKHRAMIQKELLSYFYKKELQTIFDEKEIMNMKERFEKNYVVLISNANFSKSLISSEWYYTLQVKTDAGIEQTAIVAGYLKSIEQLLFSILLVLSENENNKFMFYANQEGREKTGQKKLPLNYANQKLVLTMAKNILKVIEGNKKFVLHRTEMTDRVIGYLEQYVEKTRNAYMHKDNLYDWSDIRIIRTKTYAAYFMILGTFFIDVEKLLDIND